MTLATNLSSRLRALSRRERILLLSCAAFACAFVAVRWGLYPALDAHRKSREAVPRRLETVARYRLAAQGEERIETSFSEAAKRLEAMEGGLLPGDSPAAAGSALQGLLKPLVARPDTRLTSVRTLAPVPRGAYSEVAVQMDLQTTTEGLAALLSEVSRHPKALRVKKLSVNSAAYGLLAAVRRETLAVSVVIAGVTAATRDAKGEGAEP